MARYHLSLLTHCGFSEALTMSACVNRLLAGLAVLGTANFAFADVIYESAVVTNGRIANFDSVGDDQFMGARFALSSTVEVSDIGADLLVTAPGTDGGRKIFGAILSLTDADSLPPGAPFDSSDVVASTAFSVDFSGGQSHGDFLTPLSATLRPGEYAVVFGSGFFGATGNGGIADNYVALPNTSGIRWSGLSWVDFPVIENRFLVLGEVVPEPSTFVLISGGLILAIVASIVGQLATWRLHVIQIASQVAEPYLTGFCAR